MDNTAPALLPAQQVTLDAIRTPGPERPSYPGDFAAELRNRAESALAELVDAARDIDSRGLWVRKRDLAGVFGCQARHRAEAESPFA
ncbi:hypothetical protein, partial [Candidatus Poriferisodalis sp.]|uniref:hypothetical protein n=1 Tax=Candidatus Poriferisodalis sp. TaxID=3101277 RepID=UPI003B52745D